MTDIASLSIRIDSIEAKLAKNDLDKLTSSGKNAESQMGSMSNAAVKLGKALAAAFVSYKIAQFTQDVVMAAARYETLGVVMLKVGSNAGYTASQVTSFSNQIRESGIQMDTARQVTIRMIQAQIDMSQASKLARIAQDAAVIGQINSSEALKRMVHGIQTAETEIMKGIGLNVSFEKAYKKLADQLGVNKDSLTEQQKMQARVNETMEVAKAIAGSYEASMTTAGKQINSFTRYIGDFKIEMGQAFNPSTGKVVAELTDLMKALSKTISSAEAQEGLEDIAEALADMTISAASFIKEQLPGHISTLGTAVSTVVSIYNSIPSELTGPAGVGIVGAVLFGGQTGKIVATIVAVNNGMSAMGNGLGDLVAKHKASGEAIMKLWNSITDAVSGSASKSTVISKDFSAVFAEHFKKAETATTAIVTASTTANTAAKKKGLTDQEKALKASIEEQKRALEAFNDDYKKATLSTFEYEVEKLDEMYKEREKLVKAGLITEWQLQEWYADRYDTLYQADVENYYDAQEQKIAAQKKIQEEQLKLEQEAADEAKRISDEAAEAQQEAYDELYDGIYGFTRNVIDDWDDMGNTLVDMAESMVKDIISAFITQKIAIPIYMYAADMAGISTGLASGMSPSSGGLASMTSPISSLFTIGKTAYTLVTEGVSAAVSDLVGADLLGSISSAMFGETAATAAGTAYTTISPTVASTIESAYAVANGGTATSTGAASGAGMGGAAAAGLAVAAFMAIDQFLGSHDQADPDIYVQSPTGGLTESTATYTVSNRDAVTDEIVTIFDAAFASLDESLDANIVDAVTASAFRGKARITDLDETDANALINALVESAFSGDYTGSIASFEGLFGAGSGTGYKTVTVDGEDTEYWNNILTPLTEAVSGQYSKGLSDILMEAIGLDSGVFDFDFLKSLQAEGENLFDTFASFAIVVQETDGFVENITRQMNEFGFTVEEAFANILVVISVLDEIQAYVDALATTSSVAALNTLTESWYALIDSLEAAYATTTQITEAETAMAQVLGANITGLTANALQSALSEGSDIESILQTSIQNAAYADIAQKIAEEYISGINEQIGQVWIDTGGDLEAVAEAMQDIDTTEAQAALEELQESFGLLAESANDALDTSEAMRIVTLAIEGQLTVAQKFEEWQIENIEAMNMFSEIAANSVTADELESAVDAFAALGIEGDDLSNVIQDLADTFTEATQQMYENISNIESAQNNLIGADDTTQDYLNAMTDVVDFFKNTPSLSQIRGDESITTTTFDEDAYRKAIADAVVKSEYQSILGRNPDSDYWQNELIDGDIVMSSIHDAILAAISEPEDVVEEIYNRLFGHSADSAGLAYWLGELESGALSISGLESALIAGAQGSDIDYYNENKGQVEITNWEDFETAAGLLGIDADDYNKQVTSHMTGEFSTSQEEVEAALAILNDLPDILDSSGNLISSALDEIVNTIGTMDSAVLEDIFGSAASEQINALVSAISNYESSFESDSDTSEGSYGTDTDETQSQIDAIYAQIQEGIDTINLSDFEKEIYDINKQAQEWTDILAELGVTAAEDLAIIDEWVTAQRNALAEGIAEEWQNIINENSLTDADLQLIALDAWFDDQKAAATELGMSLDALTEAYDLQISAIDAARQAEIDSILESASDYLDKSGMSDFESQMIDLEKEAASLNEQLTALNATNEELAVITEWLSTKERELIDARQAEIDAFNDTIQDIISQNTLSDLEYELEGLTDWYEEQKAAAEDLGIALDAVNKAYELQKEAAYEASVTAARTTYIESLQEEQTILEDTLSLAKENYINGLNDEIDALNETAAEAEKTAESFESLLETIKELKYSSVTDSELNPDKQMAFVGAELAAAMAKIQSGDATEIQAGMEDLPALTSDFLELSKQTSGSFSAYQNDFAYVMRILNEAEQIAGDQKSTAELSLDELTSQTAALEATLNAVNGADENLETLEELEAAYNSAKTDLDYSWYQDEIDRLTEINSSVMSLEESVIAYIGVLSDAVNAGFSKFQSEYAAKISPLSAPASSSPSIPAIADDPSTTNFYEQLMPTTEDALLMEAAKVVYKSATGGISSETFNAYSSRIEDAFGTNIFDAVGWGGDPEALKAEYGFSNGGTVTGPDSGYFLPTTFHGTEHITPDSEMTDVKEVLGEVKDILISIRDTGGNVNKLTIQTNRLLDRVTQGGTEMRVREIA